MRVVKGEVGDRYQEQHRMPGWWRYLRRWPVDSIVACTGAMDARVSPLTMLITTADQPESKRFAFWRDAVCNNFPGLDFQPNSDRSFFGEIATTIVDEVGFSSACIRGKFNNRRTPHWIHKDKKAVLFVSLVLKGKCLIAQDGREAVLGPGDLACFDSIRPYSYSSGESDDFEQLFLHMPYEMWVRKFGSTKQVTARRLRGNTEMGVMVSNFLRQVVPCTRTVDSATAHRLKEISLALLTTALGNLVAQQAPCQSLGRISLLYRARTFIWQNLHDPSLNSEKIAQALKISERYLHELFHEESSTISNWIWDRRLEKSRQDLSNPLLAGKSIGQIAFNCGFSDLSHFSHRFKAAFSITPSEFRRDQLALKRQSGTSLPL